MSGLFNKKLGVFNFIKFPSIPVKNLTCGYKLAATPSPSVVRVDDSTLKPGEVKYQKYPKNMVSLLF